MERDCGCEVLGGSVVRAIPQERQRYVLADNLQSLACPLSLSLSQDKQVPYMHHECTSALKQQEVR